MDWNGFGARSGVVRWGNALQVRRSRVRFPMVSLEIFHWHNPSGRTMALGLDSASNRNVYQENILRSKGGRCLGLTTLLLSCADYHESWEPQPSGALRDCPGLYRDCFTFTFTWYAFIWFRLCHYNIEEEKIKFSVSTPRGYVGAAKLLLLLLLLH